jgi:hypothetical protein
MDVAAIMQVIQMVMVALWLWRQWVQNRYWVGARAQFRQAHYLDF